METKKENNLGITVTVTGQTQLTVTGAKAVEGVTPNAVTVTLPLGRLTARGKDLKVKNFLEGNGELTVTGTVESVSFSGAKAPLLKRMFH